MEEKGGIEELTKKTLHFESPRKARTLFANNDSNLRLVEKQFDVELVSRDGFLKIEGPPEGVSKTLKLFEQLEKALSDGIPITDQEFKYFLEIVAEEGQKTLKDLFSEKIQVPSRKKLITPKTLGQKSYVEAIRTHDIVFGIGPAGTGKTYLAMAMAVEALHKNQVRRLILSRPAVEAGETLGFLPGDLYEKITPYLRPLYDALYDMMEVEVIERNIEKSVIEIAPLAYMRGRTLNDSFIILDEAQNSTVEQMKMFLTRLGFGSKAVITGDITQVDLPSNKASGLVHAKEILREIEGVHFCFFSEKDVLRHPLVQKIIRAYENNNQQPK